MPAGGLRPHNGPRGPRTGRHFPCGASRGSLAAMSFPDDFSAEFPISAGRHSLELPEGWIDENSGEVHEYLRQDDNGDWRATLRFVGWDVDGDTQSIRDIKEQELVVLHARHLDDPRVPAYVAGWAAALRHIFEVHAELRAANELPQKIADQLDWSMPADLCFPDALDLKRPKTAADFTDALLSGARRLGGLLS